MTRPEGDICRVGKARTCPRVPTAAVRVGTAREERSFAHPTLADRTVVEISDNRQHYGLLRERGTCPTARRSRRAKPHNELAPSHPCTPELWRAAYRDGSLIGTAQGHHRSVASFRS